MFFEMFISVLNIFKSLLFTPIKSIYGFITFSSSFSLWISAKTSRCNSLASLDRLKISCLLKTEAINKITSAPNDFDSTIWNSSKIKSFLKIGPSKISLAIFKSSFVPPKKSKSVRTEIPQTPASWYPRITSCIFSSLLMISFEGDFLLCSAIIPELLDFNLLFKEIVSLSKNKEDSNWLVE